MSEFIPSIYQQKIFDWVKGKNNHAVVEAVSGCLSGDTIIRFNRASKGFEMSLEKAYKRFNRLDSHPKNNWDKSFVTKVRSFCGSEIRLHQIVSIVESGIKPVFLLKLKDGSEIKATSEHEFLTNHGWVKLSDLKFFHEIMCDTLLPIRSGQKKPKLYSDVIKKLNFHPFGQSYLGGRSQRIEIHRAIFEANLNNISLDDYIHILRFDSEKSSKMIFVDPSIYEIHHKDFNHKNNEISNLEKLTREEHRKIHGNHKHFGQGEPRFVSVDSVSEFGNVMTYDIVCEDPHRNFVANGMVVHNSGKTTTSIKSMSLIDPRMSVLYVAFNKHIVNEIEPRVPDNVKVLTLNSLGFRSWCRYVPEKITLEKDKTRDIVLATIDRENEYEEDVRPAIYRMISLAKANGLVPKEYKKAKVVLMHDTDNAWHELIDNYDIEFERRKDTAKHIQAAISLARRVLLKSCESKNVIDFDDQIYLPVIHGLKVGNYDWVFVDEAQDLSSVQHELVLSSVHENGRVMAVGDSRQAIYAFRGASCYSMAMFRDRLSAKDFDLPVCYRCPKSHVDMAQVLVPQIQSYEGSIDGDIIHYGVHWDGDTFRNDDFIVCRCNAPLAKMAYRLLRLKIPVRILGRDFGKGITSLIKSFKVDNIPDMKVKLASWFEKKKEAKLEKNPQANLSDLEDKRDTILTFADMFPDHKPIEIIYEVERMYSGDEKSNVLTLATVHKVKGLEADRVFILNKDLFYKFGKTDDQKQQERNIEYIALTRAKKHLGFVEID